MCKGLPMLAREQVKAQPQQAAWADHRVCRSKEGAAQLMQLLGKLCLDGLLVPSSLHLVMWQHNAESAFPKPPSRPFMHAWYDLNGVLWCYRDTAWSRPWLS